MTDHVQVPRALLANFADLADDYCVDYGDTEAGRWRDEALDILAAAQPKGEEL